MKYIIFKFIFVNLCILLNTKVIGLTKTTYNITTPIVMQANAGINAKIRTNKLKASSSDIV